MSKRKTKETIAMSMKTKLKSSKKIKTFWKFIPIMLVIIMAGFVYISTKNCSAKKEIVETKSNALMICQANIRDNPSLSGKIIGKLEKGDKIDVKDIYYDYIKISVENWSREGWDGDGWVYAKNFIIDYENLFAVGTKDTVIRTIPNKKGKQIGVVKKQQKVKIFEVKPTWYKIELKDGKFGWVCADLVKE